MRTAAVVLLVGALTACNFHAKHDNDGGDENVTISGGEDGKVSFNLPFVSGAVKLPAGAVHGGDIDIDGVKMYPGASVNSFHVEANDDKSVVNIGFKAPDAPDKIRAYFLDQFKQKGVQANASGDGISGKSKDGSPFEIHVQPNGTASQGTIRIEDHDKD